MIAEFRGRYSGPVALLGGGESVDEIDTATLALEMPIIGINDSWRKRITPWMVYADPFKQSGAPCANIAFVPSNNHARRQPPKSLGSRVVAINHLPRVPGERPAFMGLELSRGSYAYFSGMLALEVAAWCGYDRIVLLGFDCKGSHFYDRAKETPGGAQTHETWRGMLDEAETELKRVGVSIEYLP